MLRHWITFIDYPKLIEMQANQVTGRISKQELRCQYKEPNTSNKRNKIIKIGKRK